MVLGALPRSGRALIDVREPAAYAAGHLPGSVSLPRRLLEFELARRVSGLLTPIELYAHDDELAELAARTVREMGYRFVTVAHGALAKAGPAGLIDGSNVASKAFAELIARERRTPSLQPEELEALWSAGEDVAVIDVRPPLEYLAGHIPGALNLMTGELVLAAGSLTAKTVVLHCGGRTRAIIAAEVLREAGRVEGVFELENGTAGWRLSGRAVETGESGASGDLRVVRDAALARPRGGGAEAEVATISPEELKARWDKRREHNIVVFDCRREEEYLDGHVPGASHLPLVQILQAIDDHLAVSDTTIVVTCDSGARSTVAVRWLERMGYPKSCALVGGTAAYEKQVGPLELGRPAETPFGLEAARAATTSVGADALRGATVISLDTSNAYDKAHLKGATWICRSRLEMVGRSVLFDKDLPVVVASLDDAQSFLGARTLVERGHRHVGVLEGGPTAWARSGLEVEQGGGVLADEPDDVSLPASGDLTALERYLAWEIALDEHGRSPVPLFEKRNRKVRT